jgi:hypothetical protein
MSDLSKSVDLTITPETVEVTVEEVTEEEKTESPVEVTVEEVTESPVEVTEEEKTESPVVVTDENPDKIVSIGFDSPISDSEVLERIDGLTPSEIAAKVTEEDLKGLVRDFLKDYGTVSNEDPDKQHLIRILTQKFGCDPRELLGMEVEKVCEIAEETAKVTEEAVEVADETGEVAEEAVEVADSL